MLDTVLWLDKWGREAQADMMFQSLLCWILYYDSAAHLIQNKKHFCFNPYYVGYCTMTFCLIIFLLFLVLFQSLLCWILYYDSILFITSVMFWNVSILIMLDTVLWPALEVSIAILSGWFQSLLCWILYYDLITSELASSQFCFNPYYVGYCTMT